MKFKNPVSVVSPKKGEHATNKDYVDGKMVTKTWTEYQALSEEEKKNGTLYDIPDMPTTRQGGIITTYTALEQLGLSAGASVADIVNAMPDCSYAEIGCHREENPYGLEHITGLPSEDGNFILTVRKYNLYRVDIQAKTSASGAVLNDMYIGGMLANGTSVSWKRVCTTSVPDVPKTTINLDENCTGVYQKTSEEIDNTWFLVKNGWCMVQIDIKCIKEGQGNKCLATSLPKPMLDIAKEIGGTEATRIDGEMPLQVIINNNGIMRIGGGRILSRYIGSISYPVAEE